MVRFPDLSCFAEVLHSLRKKPALWYRLVLMNGINVVSSYQHEHAFPTAAFEAASVLSLQPLILERIPETTEARTGGPVAWIHTKALYRLTEESKQFIQGCTDEMCSTSHGPSSAHEIPDGGI